MDSQIKIIKSFDQLIRKTHRSVQTLQHHVEENCGKLSRTSDGFINLAQNKTPLRLDLTCRPARQKLRILGGREGPGVFVRLQRNWAAALRRDLLQRETTKSQSEQKEEKPPRLSLHRSPPSSVSLYSLKIKTIFTFISPFMAPVCPPLLFLDYYIIKLISHLICQT